MEIFLEPCTILINVVQSLQFIYNSLKSHKKIVRVFFHVALCIYYQIWNIAWELAKPNLQVAELSTEVPN